MRKILYSISLLFLVAMPAISQIRFVDAKELKLYGKLSDSTETRYERLPAKLKNKTRSPVWNLGKNTAGLFLRFSSNSSSISLRWELKDNVVMDHMAFTGIKGFDLYCLNDSGRWQFVSCARPKGKLSETKIISNMPVKNREFLLNFPLYDGVTDLQIGVDSLSVLSLPKNDEFADQKPIIAYGTSILQGACASRPGMAATNILTRKLSREVINLGFSGNGQLDYEIAEVMSERPAVLYLLDFVPNVNVKQIEEKGEKFFRIIRDRNPQTPILFIENPIFPHTLFDASLSDYVPAKNRALKALFNQLQHSGEKDIYYLSSDNLLGSDQEATVDGIHSTDLGFIRYVDIVYPLIQSILLKRQ
ncbi:MAG: SGNH/GDSL hydrolase family protein [Bacteroidales bacterium]